ncbi:glycoside hydrolase family 5 protein [Mycena vulgaris]|nr:glycoside hydrolase family 5 protein [Mycena vulgaris]
MLLSVVWLGVLGAVGVSATSSLDPRWKADTRWKKTEPTPPPPPTPTLDKSRFVCTDGANFQVNNSNFKFIGTNAYWLTALNTDEDVNSTLSSIRSKNITVVRTWAFNDVSTIPENGTWFQLIANGTTSVNLNETTGLPKLDRIISMAEKHGIYLLLSLTNNWNPLPLDNITNGTAGGILRRDVATNNSLPRNFLSNDFGGMDAYVRAFAADSHDHFYTNETIIAAFLNYTTQIVSRYVNSTSVLAWEIANDPRCNSSIGATASCTTTTVTNWHNTIAKHIKSIDPNHLVSSGSQGFLCADCPKLFQKTAPPPPGPSPAANSRRQNIAAPLTNKRILEERKEARKKTRALKLRSGPPSEGVRVRGKWVATRNDGSTGVDSEDILSIGFGSFQLFPDQNQYAPDDPNLPAFNNTLQAGLAWIKAHGESSQVLGKPITLTGFGLVTQDNVCVCAVRQRPVWYAVILPNAAHTELLVGNLTSSPTQLPFGVTDQQRDDAYAQWLQQGILSGLAGMIQYQWGQGNLTAMNGTAIVPTITENGLVPTDMENALSPSDGYSTVGVG